MKYYDTANSWRSVVLRIHMRGYTINKRVVQENGKSKWSCMGHCRAD